MNAQILCIGGKAAQWRNWGHELEANGYVVVHASDEHEATGLLKACPVDIVCIDSQLMAGSNGAAIVAGLKDAARHVPVVLVQTGNRVPEHFEEHVDVVIDESTFAAAGQWLIEELREPRLPMFVEWFDAWKERSADDEKESVHYV